MTGSRMRVRTLWDSLLSPWRRATGSKVKYPGWADLETEAGLFLSLGDGGQLEEVPTNDQLDAPKRLRRSPHRPVTRGAEMLRFASCFLTLNFLSRHSYHLCRLHSKVSFPAVSPGYGLQLVKEPSLDHGDLVDDQVAAAGPVLQHPRPLGQLHTLLHRGRARADPWERTRPRSVNKEDRDHERTARVSTPRAQLLYIEIIFKKPM